MLVLYIQIQGMLQLHFKFKFWQEMMGLQRMDFPLQCQRMVVVSVSQSQRLRRWSSAVEDAPRLRLLLVRPQLTPRQFSTRLFLTPLPILRILQEASQMAPNCTSNEYTTSLSRCSL